MPKGPPPRLDLSGKRFDPKTLDNADDKVQTLLLDRAKLQLYPVGCSRFGSLRALYLNHNQLAQLPEAIGVLRNLVKLHVEFNLLRQLPKSIGNLVNLKKLYAQTNLLESLPEELERLTALQVLNVHDNLLRVLPVGLGLSQQLQELTVHTNPIASPPPFICEKGIVFLLRYMHEVYEARRQTVPRDEFIYGRRISFDDLPPGQQKALNKSNGASTKQPSRRSASRGVVLTRAESVKMLSDTKTRALEAMLRDKLGTMGRVLLLEDGGGGSSSSSSSPAGGTMRLSRNHLLWFLVEASVCDAQGLRDYMEDRATVIPRLRQHKPVTMLDELSNLFCKIGYFAVFDGHGGSRCAEYLQQFMHVNICNQDLFRKGDFEGALKAAFRATDDDFIRLCRRNYWHDGSTAAVALIVDNKLFCAHAGDSRIVLCRDKKALRLTEDHKPDRADELARVEEAGGEVVFIGNCFRVNSDLAMSRSFGDMRLKIPRPVVICDPEIRVEMLTPKDEFLVLASDGLWDVLSDQRAVDIVRRCDNVHDASRRLVEVSLQMGSQDNVTAIVVKLDWSLDFVTNAELAGEFPVVKRAASAARRTMALAASKSDIANNKADIAADIETQLAEAEISSSNFRTAVLHDNPADPSGPASTQPDDAVKTTLNIKVSVPEGTSSKLHVVKAESSATVVDFINTIRQKFPPVAEPEPLLLFQPGSSEPLSENQTLSSLGAVEELEYRSRSQSLPQAVAHMPGTPSEKTLFRAEHNGHRPAAASASVRPPAAAAAAAAAMSDAASSSSSHGAPTPAPTPVSQSPMMVDEQPVFRPSAGLDEEQVLVDLAVSLFSVDDDGCIWTPLDGGKSRMVIGVKNAKFRLVALSAKQQYVLNTWIRKDSTAHSASMDRTLIVTTRPGRKPFGVTFKNVDDQSRFLDIFRNCVSTLAATS